MHLFPTVRPLHRTRRPRLERRERCGVSGAMDYQQKLAEKLTILNERGDGVLIRMNYIKKVRENRKIYKANGLFNRNKELDFHLICLRLGSFVRICTCVQLLHNTNIYLRVNTVYQLFTA